VRPLSRFCRARDNLDDRCRDRINLRDARTVRLRDLAAGDRRDPFFFAVLARNGHPPALRDLGKDFFSGRLLSALFETAVARLTAFRTGRPSAAAFPIRAQITPPTTAPVGPAMLPIAAPVRLRARWPAFMQTGRRRCPESLAVTIPSDLQTSVTVCDHFSDCVRS
jgi:hypothetical protein